MAGGRPTKCTPEVTQEVVRLLRAGNYFDCACEYVGISESSGYAWLARGREALEQPGGIPEGEEIYVEFLEATREATRTAEARNVALIQQAAQGGAAGDWRAAAWWLEKRLQSTWGEKRQKLEHTGPGGGAVEVHWIEKLREACGEEDEDGEG
jgi:hypothetical protein